MLAYLTHVNIYTQTLTSFGKLLMHGNLSNNFYQYLHVIFVQSPISYVWMKRKFFHLSNKRYFSLISLMVSEQQAEM